LMTSLQAKSPGHLKTGLLATRRLAAMVDLMVERLLLTQTQRLQGLKVWT